MASVLTISNTINTTNTSSPNTCQFKSCPKKLPLIPFKCRCGLLTCSDHKFYKDHNCTFDYVKMNKEILEKNNPIVIKDKIDKI